MMNENEQKLLSLYNRTRLQQPSNALDNKILTVAKNKLSYNKKKPKKIIWVLSSVAVIVLSVNVALKLVVEPSATQTAYAPKVEKEQRMLELDEKLEDSIDDSMLEHESETNIQIPQILIKKKVFKSQIVKSNELKSSIHREFKGAAAAAPQNLGATAFSDVHKNNEQLITFPFDLAELKALYPTLIITKNFENSIQIFSEKILLLNLEQLKNSTIIVTAYAQSNKLKLNINWAIKASELQRCRIINTLNECYLKQNLKGYFKHNQLVKVTWIQF